MTPSRLIVKLASLSGVLALTLVVARANDQEKPSSPPVDESKTKAEAPQTKSPNAPTVPGSLGGVSAAPKPLNARTAPFVGKGRIEQPTEALLAKTAPGPETSPPGFNNPKVAPGQVRWHETFAAAKVASSKSGKPVLLFHMMGRLDQKFC